MDKVSFGMTPNEFINKSVLTLEHYNRGEVPYPNKIYFWNYNNQVLKSQLQNPFQDIIVLRVLKGIFSIDVK